MKRLTTWLQGFQRKALASEPPLAATSRHPIAGPTVELVAANAQAGRAFVASVEALVKFAQVRRDEQLLGQLRWMRASFQHWLDVDERAAGEQRAADLEEVASELIAGFRVLVELGVQRQDRDLLAQLGNLQRAWMCWAESSKAGAFAGSNA